MWREEERKRGGREKETYYMERQVPGSAGTATAYHCMVKANYRTIGLRTVAQSSDQDRSQGSTALQGYVLRLRLAVSLKGAQYIWNHMKLIQAS
ncbi:hypothetical protein A6R68_04810 [Neotoma lepida]|uniref:alkaline phosphatase n=1 Tax=Neotoma lepida TaxID=56216 RepID=A0A1A6GK41_NEOLE|nr:hypothetical protein A6R68_04810 [Neotoma lepida]